MFKFLCLILSVAVISCSPRDSQPSPKLKPEAEVEIPSPPQQRPKPNSERPKPTEEPRPAATEASLKDKSPLLPLATSIPSPLQGDWMKVITTAADIKESYPSTKVLWRAEISSNGKTKGIEIAFGNLLNETGAIVNAANAGLEGGGGIDGAIHQKALINGRDLLREEAILYKNHHGISAFPIGSAMAMNPYGLPSAIKMVIVTVGPQGESTGQKEIELYSAIYNSLLKAQEYGAKTIAFPAVSTGIFGFPMDIGARLYFTAALQFFTNNPQSSLENIRFVHLDSGKIKVMGEEFEKIFR